MTQQAAGTTVIVGLGVSGLACLRHLQERGITVAVTDSRSDPPSADQARMLEPVPELALGGLDKDLLCKAERIVLSPGVSPDEPVVAAARARGVPVIGELELFAAAANAPVIAITGTNGKSTVTGLVGELLRCAGLDVAVGGNLGPPALSLLRSDPIPDAYVLEVSSFQLETVQAFPVLAAAVLNLSEDHLDRHGSMDRYAAIKARVLQRAGQAVLNRDDAAVRGMRVPGGEVIWFGASAPQRLMDYGLAIRSGTTWLVRGDEPLLSLGEMTLQGRHNLVNAAAALCLVESLGVQPRQVLTALAGYRGLPHRMELVARDDGVDWINDSKATNVGATVTAVTGVGRPVVLIAGGQGKGQDFTPLSGALAGRARLVLLIGEDAPQIESVLRDQVPAERVGGLEAAVARAREVVRPGDAVLLSPACASFDMFRDFGHRGDAFREVVMREVGA